MKKGVLVVFALFLLCAVLLVTNSTEAQAEVSGDYTYTVSGGKATITDSNDSLSGSITIPSNIDGYPVTAIGSSAFWLNKKLTTVTIPEGVTYIGSYAFKECTGLTKVILPDSLTTIGVFAFQKCTNLQTVTIGPNVKSVGKAAFAVCDNLTGILVDSNNGYYSSDASGVLYNKKKTTLVQAPGAITGAYTIPDTVKTINKNAFDSCVGLTNVIIGSGVTAIGDFAFVYCTGIRSVTMGNNVASIGNYAFLSCTGLASITIPGSVTSIGTSAFYGCTGLNEIIYNAASINELSGVFDYAGQNGIGIEVIIGAQVDKIPAYMFYPYNGNTSSLPKIVSVECENGVTAIGDYAFYSCDGLTTLDIPQRVTTIGRYAFFRCKNLRTIVGGQQVQEIGEDAFGETAWSNYMPEGVTYIGKVLYKYKGAAPESLTVKEGTTQIYSYALRECKGVKNITIPATVKIMGESVFDGTVSVVKFEGSKPEMKEYEECYCDWFCEGDHAEGTFGSHCVTAYYPAGDPSWDGIEQSQYGWSVTWLPYSSILNWTTDGTSITITGVKDATVTEVYIPRIINEKPVTAIAPGAFTGCTKVTKITLPDTMISCGRDAFKDCAALKEVHISDLAAWCNITFDGRNSTPVCKAKKIYVNGTLLTDLVVPEGVENITDYAFYGCKDIKTLSLPESLKTIGVDAFNGCTGLSSVTIPRGVTAIGLDAFYNCTYITEIQYNAESAEDFPLNNYVFGNTGKNGSGITLTFGTDVKRIPANLCYSADSTAANIKSIVFECAVPEIGENAFKTVTATASHNINDRTWNAETKQNYGGALTWTTHGALEVFEIPVARMILGNALEFQFGVEKTAQTNWDGAYAIIEKSWADGTTTSKTIPFEQWGTVNQYYAIVYDGLAAKEMGDEFTVTIYNGDDVAISETKYDSVRAYVERAFTSQPDTGKTMMVDMLNYGAAAQTHFGYGTDDPANNKLTDAQMAYGTVDAPAMGNYQYKGPNYLGTRFILQSRIQVQVAFSGLTDDMYAIYTYTDSSGKTQSVRVESDAFITAGSMRGIELSQLVYADARSLVNVFIYNADGTLHGMAIDSIESCAYRSSGDVFTALMKFADSAKAHLYG